MTNVIKLSDYNKPDAKDRLKLTANYSEGAVKSSANFKNEDFKTRLQRITSSIEKINEIMAELRKPPRGN